MLPHYVTVKYKLSDSPPPSTSFSVTHLGYPFDTFTQSIPMSLFKYPGAKLKRESCFLSWR